MRKTLNEIAKALDEKSVGEIDPLADLIFGETEMSDEPVEPDDEPIPAPPVLSRSEQAAIEWENRAEENYFRLFGTFSPEFERETSRFRFSPQGEAMLAEIEDEETTRFLGRAPKEKKEKDALDEFVEKMTDGFVRFLRRRGTINIATLAKRAPGSGDGSYVRRGSEGERAARTERDGELVSEYNSSGALIRCYNESASS